MKRRGMFGVAVVAAGMLLASCTSSAPSPGTDPPAAEPLPTVIEGADGPGTAPGPGVFPLVPATHAHVQLQCPLVSAIHVSDAAIPADTVRAIYVCTTAPYTDAPDGTPQIQEFVDRVAEEDLTTLLDAYAVPDEPPRRRRLRHDGAGPAHRLVAHRGRADHARVRTGCSSPARN